MGEVDRFRLAWWVLLVQSLVLVARGGATLRVLTGTHATPLMETLNPAAQSPACQAVNQELRNMWTLFTDTGKYYKARKYLAAALTQLKEGETCTVGTTPKGYMYTFPLSMRSNVQCNTSMRKLLGGKKYMLGTGSDEARSRITVPWFLLRPDLVTLERVAEEVGVVLQYMVTIGHDPETAAMMKEGCPRFSTLMEKRDIYKQRLLQVALFDLNHQLSKLSYAQVTVNICDDSSNLQTELSELFVKSTLRFVELEDQSLRVSYVDRKRFPSDLLACPRSVHKPIELVRNSHLPSLLATDFFHGRKLKKTIYATPANGKATLVFIAGVEGSGHHMWSILGKKHTVRPLYDAFTEYLCEAPWSDESWERYGPARDKLVATMRELNSQVVPVDGSKVFFLNTVFVEKAVNMYSYPWGGPKCMLKKFARVVCTIDLLDIAKMAEEAGVDFRVIVQRRALGAAIVSSSINRDFGSFVSQTRMLGISWSLLRTSLRTLDTPFYDSFDYEEMIQQPVRSTERLAKHLGLPSSHPLVSHFNQTLLESNKKYGHKNVYSWKLKLDKFQFEFMADFLYFSAEQRRDFDKVSREIIYYQTSFPKIAET